MTQPKGTTILALEYAKMDVEIKGLEKKIKVIQEKKDRAEGVLLVRYPDEEVKTIKTESGTVFLHKQIWGKCTDPEKLKTTEWSWLVKPTVNSNSLSSAVRELDKDELDNPILPEGIMQECVEVTTVYQIRVRQS